MANLINTEINGTLDVTGLSSLNQLNLGNISTNEFNQLDGITSNIQTQLNSLMIYIRRLNSSYELTPVSITSGTNWTVDEFLFDLVGMTIRGYIKATRKTNSDTGNITNEVIGTAVIPGDKIRNIWNNCFGTGPSGATASFYTANMSRLSNNDVQLDVCVGAAAHALGTISGYFTMPITRNDVEY